nr:hypothetical protein [Micromonospora sp. DSM 115978]
MRWLLLDLAIVTVAIVLLGLTGLAVWRKIRTVRTAAAELSERAAALGKVTAELSERLVVADVMA